MRGVELTDMPDKHTDTSRRHLPDAAACYALLGKLYAAHGDSKKAIEYFVEALKLNPFMWDAFTGLCDIGAVVRPQNIFKITPEILSQITYAASNGYKTNSMDSFEGKNPFVSPSVQKARLCARWASKSSGTCE